MAPSKGAQLQLSVVIQPTGATLESPAPFSLRNIEIAEFGKAVLSNLAAGNEA
jgi:hypothetical protein